MTSDASERFLSTLVAGLPPTVPFVPAEALQRQRGASFVLRLGANESPFGIAPGVQEVLRESPHSVSLYCDSECFELREALAAQLSVRSAQIVVGAGIDDLLGLVCRACLNPGDRVVTSLGAYPTFLFHATGYGAKPVLVPYRPDGYNDLDGLAEHARASGARLLFLANPDNPSGTFADKAAVAKLVEQMPRDCLLLLDEAYADYVPADALVSSELCAERVIRLRTFSKAHGLAGARIGYAIGAAALTTAFDRVRLHYGVSRLAQEAALAALRDPGFVTGVVAATSTGRDDYVRVARELGLGALPSHANFVAIDLGSANRARRALAMLLERGVFLRMPSQPPLDRCIRVTVGKPNDRRAFADHLKAVVENTRHG